MKKLIGFILALLLVCNPFVFAEGTQKGTSETGTGSALQEKVESVNELRLQIQERQQEMLREMSDLSKEEQNVYQKQNRVRLAVQTLLAMENIAGEVGPQISQIAREFDNSVKATIKSEEKIQTRSAIARFFAGGDKESAEEIEKKVTQNRQRIQELNQLREQCSNEIKTVLMEQIQNMEKEQTRLKNLAQEEIKSKGLFGWIWK